MNKNNETFLHHVLKTCIKHDIGFNLINKERVDNDGIPTNGTFGEEFAGENPVLSVATSKPEKVWVRVLVHEFAHLIQYLRETDLERKIKRALFHSGKRDPATVYFEWIEASKRTSKKLLVKSMEIIRNFEREAELIAVQQIKRWNLPINIKTYIKQANSYLFWYSATLETEVWYTKKAPYRVKEIFNMMPSKFLKPEEYDELPENFLKFCYKYCI